MADPVCPKCGAQGKFHLVPARENHSVYVVFCTDCGHVVGTGEDYTYHALMDIRKELEEIKSRLSAL